MTRINLVPPEELTDQHLFAEWREIKMVPKSLARSIKARGVQGVLRMVPREFTLNTGHVSFFYDKGAYLATRYDELTDELVSRGVNFNREAEFDPDKVYLHHAAHFFGRYTPTEQALQIIRQRIAEKIAMKPQWYRYKGQPLTTENK